MNAGVAKSQNPPRARLKIGHWVVRAALAFIFVSTGLEKFGIGPGVEWIRIFAKIGFGDWFRYLTGALEIAGGFLLLVPPITKIGAVLLVSCMVGAIYFHIFVLGDPFSSVFNLGLIAAILGASRNPTPEDEALTTLELH